MLLLTFIYTLQPPTEVDFRIMSTFVEFYTTMMGFINYKLYSTINLFYPPKVSLYMHVGYSWHKNSENHLLYSTFLINFQFSNIYAICLQLELESHSIIDDLEKCAEDERREEVS